MALTCNAKLKHQKNMNALGKALGPKDFQGQRLTACHCVINYTVKSNFRLESDVNYGHSWLLQLKWRILFSISKSVQANIDVTTY